MIAGSDDLDKLLELVRTNHWYPKLDPNHVDFKTRETAVLRTFQVIWGEVAKPIVSPPNSKASLLHWRVIL